MEMEKKRSAIVFYPSPGRGHLNPVLELSKQIIKHHPSILITIITSCLPRDTPSLQSYTGKVSSDHQAIEFIHLEAPLSGDNSFLFHPISSTREYVATLFELPKLNNPSLHRTLSTLSKTSNIKAFVMDFFCHFAVQVLSSFNVPTYYLQTAGAFGAAVLFSLPTIDKNTTKSLKDRDILLDIPGAPSIPSKDMPEVNRDKSHRVYHYFIDASMQMAKSEGIILNTFEALEPRTLKVMREGKCTPGEPQVPAIYCVGPLTTPYYINSTTGGGGREEHECLTWLDSQPRKSVLFLCFGRFGNFSSSQLKEMAIGLERSGVRFLWVVRNPPDHHYEPNRATPNHKEIVLESLFQEGFLKRTKHRGLVVKMWAPQFAVLNHGSIGGFVTHCGWSSILEAVQAGVPMVAWPLYAEQKMNRVYLVEEIKVALALKENENGMVSADELAKRVTELMTSDKGKDVRKKAADLKEAARKATSEAGSSHVALAKLVDLFHL